MLSPPAGDDLLGFMTKFALLTELWDTLNLIFRKVA